jgi:predicted DCC family thiol-disulfide oxidoreductase YuxK
VTRASPRYTLVYDGECRFCTRSANVVRRWDRRYVVEILPSQDPTVAKRFPWIPASHFAEAMQLVREDGTTWQGAKAVEQLLAILPRGRWFSWMFWLPLARPMANRVYRWIARNRNRLGCGDHCRP